MSDDGAAIASSFVATFHELGALLPAIETIERIGLADRAIARRRAERTLIEDIPPGNATPVWLANDFDASRRHALIVTQVIKLCQKLTDDAVTMFNKLMGKLFSPYQRHVSVGRGSRPVKGSA